MTNQFNVPPTPWENLLFSGLDLYDEGTRRGKIDGINFIGEKIQASIVITPTGGNRGVVVVKSENPIGSGAALPAYFTSSNPISTPLYTGTLVPLDHSVDSSNNISLLGGSSTKVQTSVAGTFWMNTNVIGAVVTDICGAPSPYNDAENYFTYIIWTKHYNSGGGLLNQTAVTDFLSFDNCTTGGSLNSRSDVLYNMSVGDYVEISITIGRDHETASPDKSPATVGSFQFTMNRVSLGS